MSEFFDRGLKAKDHATLVAGLSDAGLLISADDGDGGTAFAPAAGIAFHFIGPITTTPAVIDDDGNVTTAAVETVDVHANIRLFGARQSDLEAALLAAFPDTAAPMTDDGSPASYVMDLRVPITCVWA